MTIQLSDCCKATIDLDKTKERPECYTCSKCGRIIGSPLETPRIEEMAQKLMQKTTTPGGLTTQHCIDSLTEAHQAGRDEEVGKCNYLKIVTHRVFIHPDDEKKNIPPVFEANVELQNVDTNRITYPTVLFKYDTIKPLQDNK